MKKSLKWLTVVFVVVFGIGISGTCFAESTMSKGTVELSLVPFSTLVTTFGAVSVHGTPQVTPLSARVGYFVADGLSVVGTFAKSDVEAESKSKANPNSKVKETSETMNIGIGVMKHFTGTGQTLPYVGGGLLLVDASDETEANGVITDKTEVDGTPFYLEFGMKYLIKPNFGISAGILYVTGDLDSSEGTGTASTNSSVDLKTTMLSLGWSLYF